MTWWADRTASAQASGGTPGQATDGRGTAVDFPPGQFPVKLPVVSLLGARNDLPNPYRAGVSWGELPNGRRWGNTAGIAVGPDGNIWVIDRCGFACNSGKTCADSQLDPILEFDPSGRMLRNWGGGIFANPHKITVDKDGNVWVTDNGRANGKGKQAIKFNPDGKILMTLGKAGVSGAGFDEFDQPTEVAVAPNGDVFVADGHAQGPTDNARIMKFDRNGKFLKTWGRMGQNVGEFDVIHTLAFDSRGRLFVGDRQNNRIQIFDQDGKFIAQWFQFGRPSAIYIDKNDVMYVADSESDWKSVV